MATERSRDRTSDGRSGWRWLRRLARRILLAVAVLTLFYAGFLLLGFVPVNRDYTPPAEDDRVVLFVRSNPIHTDIVMPVVHAELAVDWRDVFPPGDFPADVGGARHVAVGWGDRRFFLETPRWSDLTWKNACVALFVPSDSVLHVEYLADASADRWTRQVHVSRRRYQRLVQFVRQSVAADAGGRAVQASEFSYSRTDRFYNARDPYHLFNTCNQWTGRGLRAAGVPTGIWTPLKPHVFWWLPDVAEPPLQGSSDHRSTEAASSSCSVSRAIWWPWAAARRYRRSASSRSSATPSPFK